MWSDIVTAKSRGVALWLNHPANDPNPELPRFGICFGPEKGNVAQD
jgi:hypothetical protein